jgi:heat shock protein HslJ
MTPRRARSSFAVAVAAITLLAACGDDSGSGDNAATTAPPATAAATTGAPTTVPEITVPPVLDPLDGTRWTLDMTQKIDVEGADSVVSSINFASGQVSGSGGCNGFGGSYTVDGAALTFGPLVSTQIACDGPKGLVEAVVMERLGQVAGFSVTAEELLLTDASGETLLRYVPAPTTVAGNWLATGYLKADGSAFVSVILDTEVTAAFQQDGTVAGSSGCNTYTGPYTEPIQGSVTVGPLASTRMACSDPAGVMEQETDYLTALQSATTFTNDGAVLTLFNAQGQQVVTYSTFSAG